MCAQNSIQVRTREHIGVKDPEFVFVFDPGMVHAQGAGASKEFRFFRYDNPHPVFPSPHKIEHRICMCVNIHQHFGDGMSSAQRQPNIKHGYALHRQQALRNCVGVGPKTGSVSSRQQKCLHAFDAIGTKVQRDALCSSLSMKGSLTSTCAPWKSKLNCISLSPSAASI